MFLNMERNKIRLNNISELRTSIKIPKKNVHSCFAERNQTSLYSVLFSNIFVLPLIFQMN